MLVDIGIAGLFTLYFAIWYFSIKIKSIKTVGVCKKNFACSGGSKGMFEYEIDGIKHYNGEKTAHLGTCKIDKKYTIYVDKNNHEKFVSRKLLIDLMVFIILDGCVLLFLCYAEFIHG